MDTKVNVMCFTRTTMLDAQEEINKRMAELEEGGSPLAVSDIRLTSTEAGHHVMIILKLRTDKKWIRITEEGGARLIEHEPENHGTNGGI